MVCCAKTGSRINHVGVLAMSEELTIQQSLRMWSGSTLDKAHRELGEKAADLIDDLELIVEMNTRAEGWVSETGHQQITLTIQKFEEEYCITSNEIKGLVLASRDLGKLLNRFPEVATILIELNKLPLDDFFTPPTE